MWILRTNATPCIYIVTKIINVGFKLLSDQSGFSFSIFIALCNTEKERDKPEFDNQQLWKKLQFLQTFNSQKTNLYYLYMILKTLQHVHLTGVALNFKMQLLMTYNIN